jgi:transposase-like protein
VAPEVYQIETKAKNYKRPDGSERNVPARHLFKCKACRRQFSVTKGTIFEDNSACPVYTGHVPHVQLEEGHQRPPDSPL